ncbi:MAG: hypothetical protein IT431_05855 [Phycisphaerales bacterium]|nr:hypothetical protein [Phycisphaerales bacterium]
MAGFSWEDGTPVAHSLLQQLLEFAADVGRGTGRDFSTSLDDIGLLLELGVRGYDATPRNATVFATTGGDGVHFSLLHRGGEVRIDSPVVMTVPFAFESPNHIAGADLREFLDLGFHTGYFSLEGIAYSGTRDEEISALSGAVETDPWPEKVRLLGLLRDRFSLRPWPDVEARLAELQEGFIGELRVPSD